MTPHQKAQLDAILRSIPQKFGMPDNSEKGLIKRLAWLRVKKSNPSLWYEEDRIKRDFRFNAERYGHESARQMLQAQVEGLEEITFTAEELEAMQ